MLYDADLNQRVNAQLPYGTPLPTGRDRREKAQEEIRKALLHAHVSNLVYAPLQKRHVVVIVVPVEVETMPGAALAATIPGEVIGDVADHLDLPQGWFGGIFDRDGITIARVPHRADYVAQPAPADLLAGMEGSKEGTLASVTRDGVPVLAAYSRSAVSGWTATVAIPLSMLEAPVRRSLVLVGIGGSFLLLAGIGGTALIGRRLARPAAEQLEISDERFRSVADNAPVLIWVSGPDKRCIYFNAPWLAFTGRMLEQELGDGWADGIHPDDLDRCLKIYSSHFDRRAPFRMEYRLRHADGEHRWVEDRGVPQLGRDGSFFGYIGSCIDITERKLAEQAIRDSEERFRVMAETVPAMLFTAGPDGTCDYANQRYHAYVGTSAESAEEIDWVSRVHPGDVLGVSSEWRRCTTTGRPYSDEFRLRGRDGRYRWFAGRAQPIRDADGRIVRWLGSALDVDDLKRASVSLEHLASRLLNSQEEERRRIARELHDSTAQVLVAASLNIARLATLRDLSDARAAAVMADLVALNDQALQEVRTLSYLFHPPTLDEQGLEPALRSYVDGFARRSGVEASVDLMETSDRLPRALETALFRVAQESLANIHRHSGAAKAYVHLWRAGRWVVLEVKDDGKGIGHGAGASHEAQQLGVGIAGMRTRLRQLGGELEIDSGPGGTTVTAMVRNNADNGVMVDLASRRRSRDL
jgi:PAS domain S-box-containing protein